jgi:PKD repeat protein
MKKAKCILLLSLLAISTLSLVGRIGQVSASQVTPASSVHTNPSAGPDATPTDPSYMLWDTWGGTYSDAEKRPPDDGVGNSGGQPGGRDDELCWAATASNILEWTGWGSVSGMMDCDQMFQHCQDYWYDTGSWIQYAWQWWFDGSVGGGSYLDHPGGGNFWPTYTFSNYYAQETNPSNVMSSIDSFLHQGYGCGIHIFDGGHAITVWGFSYDPSNPRYYTGLYVTDSDDKKYLAQPPPAPNDLRYETVEYNATANWWYFTSGLERNWHISDVQALMRYPDNRPVADAGGPYVGYEGSAITFDGSASTDADGDTLQYRWDFNNDGVWDTAWSTSATASNTWYNDYTGTVVLQVYDGHMSDVDSDMVTVNNVAPIVNAGPDKTSNEGATVSFSGSFTDPGTADTHTISWNFGDGHTYSGTLTPTHIYGDNGVYTVTLTVIDNDGGIGTDTLVVTVNNVAPSITPFGPFTVNEGKQVTITASSSDPGSDDLTYKWEFQIGPTITHVYYNNGVSPDPYPSPGGTYPFSKTDTVLYTYGDNYVYTVKLTVTDDDGGSATYTTTVTVNNVAPAISGSIVMTSPNPANPELILPSVHKPLFKALFTDPGTDDLTFTWDWGDGTADTTIYYNNGIGPDPCPSPEGTYPFSKADTIGHIYSGPGTYTVTLTVKDDDGGVSTATCKIKILSAEEAKHIIDAIIQALPANAFKGQANQRKNAFNNMFTAIDYMFANKEYQGAIMDLKNNIRSKMDGSQGGSPNDDWIADASAQADLCWKIDALIAYLQTLL